MSAAPCDSCRKTEHKLAEAIIIIEKMLAAGRCLANAQRAANEATDSLREQRVSAARWIEGLS